MQCHVFYERPLQHLNNFCKHQTFKFIQLSASKTFYIRQSMKQPYTVHSTVDSVYEQAQAGNFQINVVKSQKRE